jgi:hypothetical protein
VIRSLPDMVQGFYPASYPALISAQRKDISISNASRELILLSKSHKSIIKQSVAPKILLKLDLFTLLVLVVVSIEHTINPLKCCL